MLEPLRSCVWSKDDGMLYKHTMGNVVYIPLLKKNLFLVRQVVDKGVTTTCIRNNCLLTTQEGKGEVILIGVRLGKFYRL
jgi:hypothetical protein